MGRPFRFIFIRQQRHFADKGPVQLDLFVPYETGHEFKVIVTNKTTAAASVIAFHHGRGSQEAVFADLKGDCHMAYVAVRRLHGNQTYLLAPFARAQPEPRAADDHARSRALHHRQASFAVGVSDARHLPAHVRPAHR